MTPIMAGAFALPTCGTTMISTDSLPTPAQDAPGSDKPYRYAWLVVALFLLCYVFSYIDRQVLSLLVQPIKASMGLSDTQIGLLQGFAFGLFYAIAGVPIAWLIDSGRRTRIAWICIAAWSFATMGCGVVRSFAGLLVMRASTAIGEAGLPTAAMSIFADIFPRNKLSKATGFFILGPFIGGGSALLLAAAVLNHYKGQALVDVFGIASLEPWRVVFIAVGAPGLLLAAAVAWLVREPLRRKVALRSGREDDVEHSISIPVAIRTLVKEHMYLVVFTLGLTFASVVFFAFGAWFPTYLIRQFSVAPSSVGAALGPIFIGCGVVGTLLTSQMVAFGAPADPLRRIYLVIGITLIGVFLSVSGLFLVSSWTMSLVVYGSTVFFMSGAMSLAPIPAQLVLPNRMRAQGMSLQALVFSVFGAGGAPLLVGAVADGFGSGAAMPIGRALGLVALPSTVLSMALFALSYRMLYRKTGAAAVVPLPGIPSSS